MSNPFRYFNSSPEVIRLVVMMYVGTVNLSKRGVEGAPNLLQAIRRWRLSSRSRAKLQRPAHAKRGESQQW
jgi:hypothetical protein